MSKGLYSNPQKQVRIAEQIDGKADEIESYLSRLIRASREALFEFEVKEGEFYLSGLMDGICTYYREKLSLVRTEFQSEPYSDCLLYGDPERSVEVLQNIMENAIKYGDGKQICVSCTEEENAVPISIENSGCSLTEAELPHIFESFWRGMNAGHINGSGLGLYICRGLMHRMGREVFASIEDGAVVVTAVFNRV